MENPETLSFSTTAPTSVGAGACARVHACATFHASTTSVTTTSNPFRARPDRADKVLVWEDKRSDIPNKSITSEQAALDKQTHPGASTTFRVREKTEFHAPFETIAVVFIHC